MSINLNLRTKLTGAHLVGILMLLAVTVVAGYSVQKLAESIDVLGRITDSHTQIFAVENDLLQVERHLNRYALSGDGADKAAYVSSSSRLKTDLKSTIASSALDESERSVLRAAGEKLNEAIGVAGQAFTLASKAPAPVSGQTAAFTAETRARFTEAQSLLITARGGVHDANQHHAEESKAALKTAETTRSGLIYFLLILGSAAIIVGLTASAALHRAIVLPIRRLSSAIDRVSAGERDVQIPVRGHDEISHLTSSFNTMTDELRLSHDKIEGQNFDLERRVVGRTRELTALNVMANIAAQSLDLGRIVSDTFRKVLDLVGIEAGMVHIFDDDRGRLTLRESVGIPARVVEEFRVLADEQLIMVASYRTAEAMVVPDLLTIPSHDAFARVMVGALPESRCLACVPLRAKNTVLGVMTLLSTSRSSISPGDLQLLTSVAHQIGVAAENARLYQNTVNYAETVAVLSEIDRAILSTLSLDGIARQVIANVQRLIPCDHASLSVLDRDKENAVIAGAGDPDSADRDITVPIAHTLAQQVLTTSRLVINPDLSRIEQLPVFERRLKEEGIRSYVLIPLAVRGDVIGTMNLGSRAESHFSERDLGVAQSLANQIAVAIDNAKLYEGQKEHYISSIRALAAAVDARDPYTAGHSERVAEYAVRIAMHLGLSAPEIETIQFAGLLHDIGKIGIADEVLKKAGPLDPAERTTMISHATISHTILKQVDALRDILLPVRHHHEWFGGGGYPDSLAGDDIPHGARILAVADAFEAMTSTRPYRRALPISRAKAALIDGMGGQFDPAVVDAFSEVLTREEQLGTTMWASLVERTESSVAPDAAPAADEEVGLIHPSQSQSLTILYRIAQEMHAILDLPLLLDRMLEILSTVHGKGRYSILLLEPETGDLIVKATTHDAELFVDQRIAAGTGVTGWTAQHGQATLVADTDVDIRYQAPKAGEGFSSELAVPLVTKGKSIGVLDVGSSIRGAFNTDDIRLLTAVAAEMASAIEVAQLHSQMREDAVRDGLTGLHNHRYFYDRLNSELDRSKRYGKPLSVVVFDIDGLKEVNDQMGHLAGDEVLRVTAQVLAENVRACDVAARYGGDEFVVIMPEAGRKEAEEATERLMALMDKASYSYDGLVHPLPGRSYGASAYPTDADNARDLFNVADDQVLSGKKGSGLVMPVHYPVRQNSSRPIDDESPEPLGSESELSGSAEAG